MKRQTKFQKWAERMGIKDWLDLGMPEKHTEDALKACRSAFEAGYRAGRRKK